jgi:hypothetical protein
MTVHPFPPPTYPVPSRRYPSFAAELQERLAILREQALEMQGQKAAWDAVKRAVERINLDNDTKITLHSAGVSVRVQAGPLDFMASFERLAEAIGRELRETGVHTSGEPSVSNSPVYGAGYNWTWVSWSPKYRRIELEMRCGDDGLTDYMVEKTERVSRWDELRLVPR